VNVNLSAIVALPLLIERQTIDIDITVCACVCVCVTDVLPLCFVIGPFFDTARVYLFLYCYVLALVFSYVSLSE
jgi:hypothetical protein